MGSRQHRPLGALWVLTACVLADVGGASQLTAQEGRPEAKMSSFKLESSAFAPSASIPSKYTCEGQDLAPALRWGGLPEKTRSLALIVSDPDAPDPAAPKRVWVHWVVYNLPAQAEGLPEGGKLPAGASEGKNDWGRTDYGGPCPPIGRHRYIHTLYALDTTLDLRQPDKAALEAAMKGHVLGEAQLIGTYQKQGH